MKSEHTAAMVRRWYDPGTAMVALMGILELDGVRAVKPSMGGGG